MNDPIRRLSTLAGVMFAILLISTTWIQFVQAKEINARPGNQRTLLASYNRERGEILVSGSPVARSKPTDDDLKWLRTYPKPQTYAHVTGYYSFIYGAGGGIEGSADSLLSGQSDKLFYDRISDIVTGKTPTGATLELTINPRAQQAAEEGLGDQRGAVVALDPKTGAILAMVSHPSYDPNRLTSHNDKEVRRAWKELNEDPARPMVNRAIAGDLYPPGSTFKIVTAAAALESGDYTPDTEIPGPAVLDLPQTDADLPNDDGLPCGPGDQSTLLVALQRSCNTSFGALGMKLGADALRNQAAKFGFGDNIKIPMQVTPSSFPDSPDEPQLAQSAIGQYDVRETPLQVAMTTAAVANGGVVMSPHMIQTVRDQDLSVIDKADDSNEMSEAISPQTADDLTRMMEAVVQSGTGTPAQIPGVAVAGKTGTAQHAEGAAPHAWFTGFAPAEDPKVAVAVVVESGGRAGNEGFGGTVAGPIAKSVMEAVLGS
jgi:peptidoglycan glycosyltransferase